MITLAALFLAYCPIQDAPQVRSAERTSGSERSASSADEVRIYDLSALTGHDDVVQLAAEIGPSSDDLYIDGLFTRLRKLEQTRARANQQTEHLLAMVRELISPPLVSNSQNLSHIDRGRFALIANDAQHDWFEAFIRAADDFLGYIDVQFKIYSFDSDQFAELKDLKNGSVLSSESTENLIARLSKSVADLVSSPMVRSAPFQKCNLSILNEVAYVKDFEIKVLPNLKGEVVDPVVDTIQSGLSIDIRCVPLPEKQISFFVDLKLTELDLPIPIKEVVVGEARQKVRIQTPHVAKIQIDGHYGVSPGETVLLRTTDLTRDRSILVLLESTRIPTNEASR